MAPIRVAFIGLSASSHGTNWGGVAHLPYLQSPQGRSSYEIVGLCNSSTDSAKNSIVKYKLPDATKIYSSPQELANDPDVDLVVNVTSVTNHYKLCLPMVQAGKNVFTELPLASSMSQMTQLLETAVARGSKTVFGLQGQTAPTTKLLREIIASGRIGKVLSSTWTGRWDSMAGEPIPIAHRALVERPAGANNLSITFLHSINHIFAVLGELSSFNSLLGMQRGEVPLSGPDGEIVETVKMTTPDHVLFQGRLESGALISWAYRSGRAFPGESNASWEIYGEQGAIMYKGPMAMSDIVNGGVTIQVHEFAKQEAETLALPEDYMSDLSDPVQNVGRIYEAYAKGLDGSYPDWKLAMKRHKLIQQVWSQFDGERSSGEPLHF